MSRDFKKHSLPEYDYDEIYLMIETGEASRSDSFVSLSDVESVINNQSKVIQSLEDKIAKLRESEKLSKEICESLGKINKIYEDRIESMKCCGNCKLDTRGGDICMNCIRSIYEYLPHMTDNWEARENKPLEPTPKNIKILNDVMDHEVESIGEEFNGFNSKKNDRHDK